ncbi:uncharacterized protein LOC134539374 [Bacillus rossius redtenbacheri]|uniref:uncharacterized protein LOC134539374 n=1 Tax=Bacillus rossius redtenbacheri TaxID=93214 RepID=UPI002FDE6D42
MHETLAMLFRVERHEAGSDPTSASTTTSVELLDDLRQDLVSTSLSARDSTVVETLRQELHALRHSYNALLESRARLENLLDHARLCRDCSARRERDSQLDQACSNPHACVSEASPQGQASTASTAAGEEGKMRSYQGSTHDCELEDEGTQKLLLCLLDALHVVSHAARRSSATLHSSLVALTR